MQRAPHEDAPIKNTTTQQAPHGDASTIKRTKTHQTNQPRKLSKRLQQSREPKRTKQTNHASYPKGDKLNVNFSSSAQTLITSKHQQKSTHKHTHHTQASSNQIR
jgi:G3E family GTPase